MKSLHLAFADKVIETSASFSIFSFPCARGGIQDRSGWGGEGILEHHLPGDMVLGDLVEELIFQFCWQNIKFNNMTILKNSLVLGAPFKLL